MEISIDTLSEAPAEQKNGYGGEVNRPQTPRTLIELVWMIFINPYLLATAVLVLILFLITSRIMGHDLVAIAIKYTTGIEVADPVLNTAKGEIQIEQQGLIGSYKGYWTWKDLQGKTQIDNDTVVIDRVDPMVNNEGGSIIRGCGNSESLGKYEVRGFADGNFISLTYTCDPTSKQPTKVGSVLLKREAFSNSLLTG